VAQALGISLYTPEKPLEEVHLDFPNIDPGEILKARVVIWREVQEDNSSPPPEDGEDIAVLKLETAPPVGAIPAPLLSKNNLEGHRFAAFGFPDGHDNGVWAYGILCGRQGAGWVQIEAEKEPGFRVEPGFSGTPIWDKKLKGIVGIAVAADLERIEAKVAFMIPTGILVKAWSKLGEWTIPPLIPSEIRTKRIWRYRPWLWISLVLIPFLGGTFFFVPQVRDELGIGHSSCFYQARKQGKQAIAVAKFNKAAASSIINPQLENQIIDRLEAQALPNVKVCPTDESVSLFEDAQKLGKKLKAAVVVWGRGGGSSLEVSVTAVNLNVRYLTKLSFSAANSLDFDLQTKDWQHLIPVMTAFSLSQTYEKEGQFQEAIDILDSALDFAEIMIAKSDNQETARAMSYAYYFLGDLYAPHTDWSCFKNRKNCEEALVKYQQALRWNKTLFAALRSQGILYERLGKLSEALNIYTQIIEATPDSPENFEIYKYRAEILLKQGKTVEAVEDFKVACQQQPVDTDCLRLLGLAQLQVKNIPGATNTYKNIMRRLDKAAQTEVISDLQSLAKEKPALAPDINSVIANLK
jgi:tetratricopeptide (TPR) repeat protein